MELRGSIKSWNDDKGFGFVTPDAGGPAVFVHISAMRGERRPQAGDAVFYIAGKDEQGRLCASHMRLQGLSLDQPAIRIKPRKPTVKAATPKRPRRPSNMAVPQQLGFKLVVFAVLCAAPLLGALQLFVYHHWIWALALYPSASLLAVVFYGHDKQRAMDGGRRTPEKTLHLLELLGGWPGALLAQQLYRHKTRKVDYQLVFWGIVLGHQLLWLDWLLLKGQYLGWAIRLVTGF
ncbi:uncharacterized membrane protein YsdA (DUF1294 family)/cold shock CspA family protein [Pseudomonas sp. TE3786]